MIEYTAFTFKGAKRKKNEDRVMINNIMLRSGSRFGEGDNNLIAIVCDGVGGERGGEVAAEMIIEGFSGFDIASASAHTLYCHIKSINQSVLTRQLSDLSMQHMASTVSGILIYKKRYLLFSLGDTRIYEIRDGAISRMTKDDTIRIIDDYHSERSQKEAITGYIGGFGNACKPHFRRGIVRTEGSVYLMCSDGIYKYISEEKMEEAILYNNSIQNKARVIREEALRNGATDDMSLVLIEANDA